uniref:Uncharacterized protein n=1 Tax=Aegilops tauschii subsp. strangulata TaxID=200361 RepID=A0A453BKI2_AEGTS
MRMAPPLPLAASTNSELNLKAIFRPGRFWDASNNQRMASALPCLDPISIGTFRVAVRLDPCSVVANALSIPPGEYDRKNETQSIRFPSFSR